MTSLTSLQDPKKDNACLHTPHTLQNKPIKPKKSCAKQRHPVFFIPKDPKNMVYFDVFSIIYTPRKLTWALKIIPLYSGEIIIFGFKISIFGGVLLSTTANGWREKLLTPCEELWGTTGWPSRRSGSSSGLTFHESSWLFNGNPYHGFFYNPHI